MTVQLDGDRVLLDRVAVVLDGLGPFPDRASREMKWRTTEQLAREIHERWDQDVSLDELQRLLTEHEEWAREQLRRGVPPTARVRRATYPDRTTVLPLWGSTTCHGQPWSGQAAANRADRPGDTPAGLDVPPDAPRVFLSHAHTDEELALRIARALATAGIGTWMFETDIGYQVDIAKCVRSAIAESAGCLAVVTRDSIASLWVVTELDTAQKVGPPVMLVVNAADVLLLRLLTSVRWDPNPRFDLEVKYDRDAVHDLRKDYARRHSQRRVEQYATRVHDFLATLHAYLNELPALAYPSPPADWRGPFCLQPLDALRDRLLVA